MPSSNMPSHPSPSFAEIHNVLSIREQVRHSVARATLRRSPSSRPQPSGNLPTLLPRSLIQAAPETIHSIFPDRPFSDAYRFEERCKEWYSIQRSWEGSHENRYGDIFAYDRTAVRVPVKTTAAAAARARKMKGETSNLKATDVDGKAVNGSKENQREDENTMLYLNANVVFDETANWWVASQAPLPSTFYTFLLAIYHQTATSQRNQILSSSLPSSAVKTKSMSTSISSSSTQTKPKPKTLKHAIIVQLTPHIEKGVLKADPYLPQSISSSLLIKPPKGLRDSHEVIELKTMEMETFSEIESIRTLVRMRMKGNDGESETVSESRSENQSTVPQAASPSSTSTTGDKPWETHHLSSSSFKPNDMLLWHFSFSAWPDFGTPAASSVSALRRLIHSTEKLRKKLDDAEVWVHCSAGVGRTGTFIALASLLSESENASTKKEEEKRVLDWEGKSPLGRLPKMMQGDKVARTVDLLREQRGMMCQAESQVELVYRVVVGKEGE